MTFFSLDEGNQNVWPRQSFSQAKKKKTCLVGVAWLMWSNNHSI